MVAWLHGCMVLDFYGCMVPDFHGFLWLETRFSFLWLATSVTDKQTQQIMYIDELGALHNFSLHKKEKHFFFVCV